MVRSAPVAEGRLPVSPQALATTTVTTAAAIVIVLAAAAFNGVLSAAAIASHGMASIRRPVCDAHCDHRRYAPPLG